MNARRVLPSGGHTMAALVLILLVGNFYLHSRLATLQTLVLTLDSKIAELGEARRNAPMTTGTTQDRRGVKLDDDYNVRYPSRMVAPADGSSQGEFQLVDLDLDERLRYMELKTNAYFNWANHYNMEAIVDGTCSHKSTLAEFDPKCLDPVRRLDEVCPGLYDHHVCLDNFKGALVAPHKPCVVYDFGIREQPEFGKMMATHFGCEVHAFDPSPISTQFYANSVELKGINNYHFHGVGAGGRDGDINLYEYNWGQVSIIQDASWVNSSACEGTQCKLVYPGISQKAFPLQVKTIPTLMSELGHKWVDIMKVDVEGSEYALMENMFDIMGCPPCDQFTVEWHHFPLDSRYGAGSSPPLNLSLIHISEPTRPY
eukprot:TRINITY_DN18364_c0_g1_i2.p1 TRINITY_DN18364_c0_g1~~TRINITY_DN18364_c0_g1_i2.p1  ORF type:complete len:371 (+),score=95.62 TRINITY_DN18364_c0_g1_i2:175-1287(+)